MRFEDIGNSGRFEPPISLLASRLPQHSLVPQLTDRRVDRRLRAVECLHRLRFSEVRLFDSEVDQLLDDGPLALVLSSVVNLSARVVHKRLYTAPPCLLSYRTE